MPTQHNLGDRLRSARVLMGYTLERLAQELQIPQKHLTALELEHFDRLPEPPLIKRYLRSLAQELYIDEAELLTLWAEANPTFQLVQPQVLPTLSFWDLSPFLSWIFTLSIGGWLILSAVYESSQPDISLSQDPFESKGMAKSILLDVNTQPSGAYVYLDGSFLGMSPVKGFPITQRPDGHLRIVKEKFQPYETRLELLEDQSVDIRMRR